MKKPEPVYTFGCWGCNGKVAVEASKKPIILTMEGGKNAYAFPCGGCGKMHWGNGQAVLSQEGEGIFLETLKQGVETSVAHIGV